MSESLKIFLNKTYFENTVFDYLFSLFLFFVVLLLIGVIRGFVLTYLKKLSSKTETKFDDFLVYSAEKYLLPVLYFGALYLGLNNLKLTPLIVKIINTTGVVLLTLYGIKFLISIITHALENYWLKQDRVIAKEKSLQGLVVIIKVIIWSAGIIFLLDNIGFKISAVIAGLGIGGVAVALAAQAVLADLFSYVAILLDRPFEVGDFVIVDDKSGTVEHIGIKTTRISSLDGEQLIFSNSDLTKSRIRNFKRMEKRRVMFKFGVVYQTTLENLKEVPKVVENVICGISGTVFDRSHFARYSDSSLDFEVVYYVIGNDYNKYMNIQQEVNLKIFEELEKRGIEFAYPTRTLYVNKI